MNATVQAMQDRTSIISSPVVRAEPLAVNNRALFSKQFEPGQGYYEARFRLKNVFTVGTGTGAIAEGELNFLRQLYLKTSKGEVILDNVPARALYKLGIFKKGAPPRKDAIVAANGTYIIDIPAEFADSRLLRPADLILDTNRYTGLTAEMFVGPYTDLLTAPGTAAGVLTGDIEIERSRDRWPSAKSPPAGYAQYSVRAPVDASVSTEILLDNSPDLSIRRILIHTSTAGVSGQPFYGANSDAIIDRVELANGDETIVPERIWEMVQDENKNDYGLESVPVGYALFDFCADGSLGSSLFTGDKGNLKLKWMNKAGVAALSYVSVLIEGYRTLKQGV